MNPAREPEHSTSIDLVQRAVVAAAVALEEAQDELCRLDAVAGDGDEGLAMATAARAIQWRLAEETPPTSVEQIVRLAAVEFGAVGGAMGALSYVIISAVGDDLGDELPLTAGRVAGFLRAAETTVSAFGGATRGDKSVLDAIGAARDAAEETARDNGTPAAAVAAAAGAARDGANATAEMEAKVGRASRLGGRGHGVVDAGAESFAIALMALAETYAMHAGDVETA